MPREKGADRNTSTAFRTGTITVAGAGADGKCAVKAAKLKRAARIAHPQRITRREFTADYPAFAVVAAGSAGYRGAAGD